MAHKCPVFLGYFLIFPFRKFYQNPEKILGQYLKSGFTILEVGPGMGFFSLPLAKMTGENGHVICVDVQDGMLSKLKKRAKNAGLSDRIQTRLCNEQSLGIEDLKEKIDFALAFAVVHELTDASAFFREVFISLKRGGRLFIAEPKGHISLNSFDNTLMLAQNCGFKIIEYPSVRQSRAAVLGK